MAFMLIFLLKNVSSFCIYQSCELDIVLTRTVHIFTTNKLVKLMGTAEYMWISVQKVHVHRLVWAFTV